MIVTVTVIMMMNKHDSDELAPTVKNLVLRMVHWIKKTNFLHPLADIHSHLIPGIDDGVSQPDQSLEILIALEALGYKKIITTPHIHPNYPNKEEVIVAGLFKIQTESAKRGINLEVEAAAEYFVDEVFLNKVKKGHPILSFGNRYVLIESSFINKPMIFEQAVFELTSRDYLPVLAHPERYKFLDQSLDWLFGLKELGVFFQVTCSSLVGLLWSKVQIHRKTAHQEKYGRLPWLRFTQCITTC